MVYEILLPTLQTQGFPNASAGRAGIDGRGILRPGHDRRFDVFWMVYPPVK